MKPHSSSRRWLTRPLLGIVLATFLSDFGHEMVTAALPGYLAAIGLGAGALGVVEGSADLFRSLAKLAGGYAGHRLERKRPLASLGYLVTALATGSIAFVRSLGGLAALRSVAWSGRGFRSPLRDFLLADEVERTHYGRAFGFERAADMLGAVAGPVAAALLVWAGFELRSIVLVSTVPALLAAASFFALTRDRALAHEARSAIAASHRLPRRYWRFVAGVALFGLGDFSRTFLVLLAAQAFGGGVGALPAAMLLYAAHNATSALAAYPAGRFGDRGSKLAVLVGGYALGVATNALLGFGSASPLLLALAVLFSGTYVAVEETLEKAVAVELLPREQRSLGLGVLASANAVGDMLSSVFVGALLANGHARAAFLVPAAFGLAGTLWMLGLARSRASS